MRRLALAGALLLGACSHVDTGQIDYRVADGPEINTDKSADLKKASCKTLEMGALCDPILPARVLRRYQPDDREENRPFKATEVYSIEIEQGSIGNHILEGIIGGRQFGRSAEFAVLANVFEFASEQGQAAQRRFLETGVYSPNAEDPSDVELKLVYFGDNVHARQPLNFSNIPLRPRTAYGGGSVGIQIVIVEVDAQSGPIASLLTTLARFGQQSIPGAPDAKDILFDLGESLFAGGTKDDRIFEYRFVLSTAADDPRAVQASFAPGRYVLRRTQQRGSAMDWSNLRLDHNTARLYEKRNDGTWHEARDDLYLVLNVRRYPEGTKPEFYDFENWSEVRQVLEKQAQDGQTPIATVTENLKEVLLDKRSAQWRSRLSLKWSGAETRLRRYSSRIYGNPTELALDARKCDASLERLGRMRDSAKREAQDALRDFLAEYQLALKATMPASGTSGTDAEMSSGDRNAVTSMVARYFMPWEGAEESSFIDADTFETTYIKSSGSGNLASLALATADRRGQQAKSCDDLIQRGLASPLS